MGHRRLRFFCKLFRTVSLVRIDLFFVIRGKKVYIGKSAILLQKSGITIRVCTVKKRERAMTRE